MARLQASYDAMSEVPAGFEGAFQEEDGKAVFSGGEFEFRTDAEYSDVRKAKQAGFEKYHELEKQLKDFDGIDPGKYKEILDELDVLRANKKGGTSEEEIADVVKSRVERETKGYESKIEELTAELSEYKGFKQKTQLETALSKALGPHVSSDAMDDAMYIIGSAIERQADGSYISKGNLGFDKGETLDDVVRIAVESKPHWKKKSVSGHGAQGSGGAGGQSKKQVFKSLVDKAQKGEASTQEIRQMKSLGNELAQEQTKG